MEFRSSTGLYEVYQFGSFQRAYAFFQSLTEYQKSVAALAERSKRDPTIPILASTEQLMEKHQDDSLHAVPAVTYPPYEPPRFLILDFAAILVIMGIVGGIGIYARDHLAGLQATLHRHLAPPAAVTVRAPTIATVPPTPRAVEPQTTREVVYTQKSANVRAERSRPHTPA